MTTKRTYTAAPHVTEAPALDTALAECARLAAKVADQDRIIKEIYAGDHGIIPHPSDLYMPGIWLIKKIDANQGHAERLMSEDDFTALKAENTNLRARMAAIAALSRNLDPWHMPDIKRLANGGQS